jgi:dihydropteroate synthase
MIAQGADIIDVGGESARTNRAAITPEEEIARIVPFVKSFSDALGQSTPRDDAQLFPPLLSINTWRPEVAAAVLDAGGDILNDMSGLPDDANVRICARHGAALLIMHSVGAPKVPHTHVQYGDVVSEQLAFFREKIAMAKAAGVMEESIILDPGIDFAKQKDDNLRLYRELDKITAVGRPVLAPVSRKSVIGRVLEITDPRERDAGTAACIVAAVLRGAAILRVHNIEMAWRTVETVRAVETA